MKFRTGIAISSALCFALLGTHAAAARLAGLRNRESLLDSFIVDIARLKQRVGVSEISGTSRTADLHRLFLRSLQNIDQSLKANGSRPEGAVSACRRLATAVRISWRALRFESFK